jgi:hypothetical protein
MISTHAQQGSLHTCEPKEQLLTRDGEGRHPSDLAHRMAKQPVAGHPAPQHHHPQRTSRQPSPDTRSWQRGSQHSGFLPWRVQGFALSACLPPTPVAIRKSRSTDPHHSCARQEEDKDTSTLAQNHRYARAR